MRNIRASCFRFIAKYPFLLLGCSIFPEQQYKVGGHLLAFKIYALVLFRVVLKGRFFPLRNRLKDAHLKIKKVKSTLQKNTGFRKTF